MHVTILGRRWRFKWFRRTRTNQIFGQCDAPKTKGRCIKVANNLTDKDTLETVIHEVLHAANWVHSEEHIANVAHDVARILWRLGYRRADDGSKNGK